MEENPISKDPEFVTAKIREYVKSVDSFMDDFNLLVKETDNGVEDFVDKNLGRFNEVFGHVITLWTSLGCKTSNEVESLMKEMFVVERKNEELSEALEDYLRSQESWDAFLKGLDETLRNPPAPNEGTVLELVSLENPGKFETLNYITSGSKYSWDELVELGCQVVVVSYGSPEGVSRWKEETKCPFPIYLDRERKLFAAHNMRRSLAKLYHQGTLNGACQAILAGVTFLTPYEGIFDDPIQIGGDVVFGSNMEVLYEYQSKYPIDRPPVESVMKCMKN